MPLLEIILIVAELPLVDVASSGIAALTLLFTIAGLPLGVAICLQARLPMSPIRPIAVSPLVTATLLLAVLPL